MSILKNEHINKSITCPKCGTKLTADSFFIRKHMMGCAGTKNENK